MQIELVAVAQYHRLLNGVQQLPDISRPGVGQQQHALVGNRADRLTHSPLELFDESANEQGDIFDAFFELNEEVEGPKKGLGAKTSKKMCCTRLFLCYVLVIHQ
jgi:DNA-directed RNA polymerase subunit N (RpoN/RPB10)